MLVIRIVIVAVAASIAVAVAMRANRDPVEGARSPFGGPYAESSGRAGTDDDPKSGSPTAAANTDTPSTQATTKGPTGAPGEDLELTPELRRAVSDDLARWKFPSHRDAGRLASVIERTVEPEDRRLLRDWFLRRGLRDSSDDAEPIPDEVFRIELTNGRALFARETHPTKGEVRVSTMTGIRTTLTASSIRATQAISRATYLRQTADDFQRRIDGLEGSRASDLETGIRACLRRGDTQQADRLYSQWLATDGPSRLARRTSKKNSGFHFAAQFAGDSPVVATAATSTIVTTVTPAGTLSRPTSFEDLAAKIDHVYRRFRDDKITKADRKKHLENLTQWEQWLEETVIDLAAPPSNLNELRLRLQHLRLDLLKSGGF